MSGLTGVGTSGKGYYANQLLGAGSAYMSNQIEGLDNTYLKLLVLISLK